MYPTSSKNSTFVPASHFYSDAKTERHHHEHRKLKAFARNFAFAHPNLLSMGDDPVVEHLLSSAGFGPADFYALRITVGGRTATAICVPTRIWRNHEAKERLLEVKRDAAAIRTTCVLVPQRWLRAPIRSSVARTIANARNARYTRTDIRAVLEHLRTNRITTLAEAADVLSGHDDPFAVVLCMSGQGFIDIDRSAPLRADTWISARL